MPRTVQPIAAGKARRSLNSLAWPDRRGSGEGPPAKAYRVHCWQGRPPGDNRHQLVPVVIPPGSRLFATRGGRHSALI